MTRTFLFRNGATHATLPTPASTDDPENPASWVIDNSGVGPVRIGDDFSETLEALPETWTNDSANCPWSAFWKLDDADYGMYFVKVDGAISIITVAMMGAPVSGAVGPQTRTGLGISASKDEVRAAYPDAVEGQSSIGESTWISASEGGKAKIFFEYFPDADEAYAVTVTADVEPPYEVCG